MIHLLLVSRSPTVRAGLRALLATEEDLSLVADERGGTDRDPSGQSDTPDVVVVDGETVTRETMEEMLADLAGVGVVLLGVPTRLVSDWGNGLSGRAWAMLRGDAEGPEIAAAARTVASHLVALDLRLAEQMLLRPRDAQEPDAWPGDELSPREREVLQLVAEGLSNRAIGARLYISEHTVKFHVASILAKLGAESRTEAVRLGARRGLVIL